MLEAPRDRFLVDEGAARVVVVAKIGVRDALGSMPGWFGHGRRPYNPVFYSFNLCSSILDRSRGRLIPLTSRHTELFDSFKDRKARCVRSEWQK
jgi:hypothetical protein